jgi:hypothetical protein
MSSDGLNLVEDFLYTSELKERGSRAEVRGVGLCKAWKHVGCSH